MLPVPAQAEERAEQLHGVIADMMMKQNATVTAMQQQVTAATNERAVMEMQLKTLQATAEVTRAVIARLEADVAERDATIASTEAMSAFQVKM